MMIKFVIKVINFDQVIIKSFDEVASQCQIATGGGGGGAMGAEAPSLQINDIH